VSNHDFWLPDSVLDRSLDAAEIRHTYGLPIPPPIPHKHWWSCYQIVERAMLRFRRALSTMPEGSPSRTRLEALWPDALAQLAVVARLCVEGSRTRITKRNPRRLAKRRRYRKKRELLIDEVLTILPSVEQFGDVAARAAFAAAIEESAEDFDAEHRQATDALAAITASLDELTALSREALDP
jgi:hypothetical protein